MRICLINYEYPPLGGGAGNATANLAKELSRLGAKVLVLTSAFKGLPARESGEFELVRLPTLRSRADRCSMPEMAAFISSGLTFGLAELRRFKPDVNIAFFGLPCGPIAYAAKLLWGTPYVVSLRGGDVPGFQPYDMAFFHKMTGPAIRFLWKRACAVVGNSKGLNALAHSFEPSLPYHLIPNGVNMEAFACPPRRVKARDEALELIFVGRLARQKGLDVLFSALADLQDHKWRLTLIGDGPERTALEAQAQGAGFRERVDFQGWQDKPSVAAALAASDLFVFPSRDEGMPNALLEAMASGLPAIATRISGNEELVVPGETGWLVEAGESKGLAAALNDALVFRENLVVFGQAAQKRAQNHFSWLVSATKYSQMCGSAYPPCWQREKGFWR